LHIAVCAPAAAVAVEAVLAAAGACVAAAVFDFFDFFAVVSDPALASAFAEVDAAAEEPIQDFTP
jgi:hypothetical protein